MNNTHQLMVAVHLYSGDNREVPEFSNRLSGLGGGDDSVETLFIR